MRTPGNLAIAAACFFAPAYSQTPMNSICEALDHRLEYNGQNIILFGRIWRTIEGTWISAECGRKLIIKWG